MRQNLTHWDDYKTCEILPIRGGWDGHVAFKKQIINT